jgi:hypothetical protein
VQTTSDATAVQIVHSPGGSRDIEHFGAAHDEVELEAAEALGVPRDHLPEDPASTGICPSGRLPRLRFGEVRSER